MTPGRAGDAALIPTGTELKSYGIMRSLHRHGIETVVASPYPDLPHFASRYCSERVHLDATPADLPAYRDALLDIARRPSVVTAYPVRECDVFVFAKYREAFEKHLSLVTPDLHTLRRAHDRLALARHAESIGVPAPETRLLSEVETWDSSVVVKSRYNVLTNDYEPTYPPDTLEEVKRVSLLGPGQRPDAEALREAMGHEPIVQAFVPQTDKHLYCALWDHGEPLATYQHRQIRQNAWVGGGGVYRESAYSQAVEDNAYDLLSSLDWHGYACIEYLEDAETGEWKFIEINPRVWQSLPEAVRAGVDFPYHYWLRATDQQELIEDDYDLGVACHIAYGELAHLRSILTDDSPFVERPSFLGTLLAVVWSSVRHPRFDYIRRDDPKLFLSACRQFLEQGVTASRTYDSGSDTASDADETRATDDPPVESRVKNS
ncbi:carboxylate--amine ligase [Halomicroarcula sp. GCM10025709]|uniref:carboxylate--amine ligase n=1 Tax=Haloarcula TaxID=2237 RepID=UPI0024C363F3|nr:carboxylate--amine ligase [Halomicroarcula sp. YJ-61-S]